MTATVGEQPAWTVRLARQLALQPEPDLSALLSDLLGRYAEQGVPRGRHRAAGAAGSCVYCSRFGRLDGVDMERRTSPRWSGVVVACRDQAACRASTLPPAGSESMAETLASYLRSGDR